MSNKNENTKTNEKKITDNKNLNESTKHLAPNKI